MYSYKQIHQIPTTIMRGGTSKGLILRVADLPKEPDLRDQVILRIYGSPDYSQIDGLGGGTALTSKLALVGPASHPDAHIDYTFGQVSLEKEVIDYKASCGNIAAAVGLYAVEEGYVRLAEPITSVCLYNTNTRRIIAVEIPVRNGQIQYNGDFSIAGVPGCSSKIMVNFLDSGGTFTGNTLPTGNPLDRIKLEDGRQFEVSIIDSANILVFVRAEDLGVKGTELCDAINGNTDLLNTLEQIRIEAGVRIGVLTDRAKVTPSTYALPKISIVAFPQDYVTMDNVSVSNKEIDVVARYISMGFLHRAFAVSGAIAIATAAQIQGTILNQIANSNKKGVRIGHPTGVLYVEATIEQAEQDWKVTRAAVGRTARRLMDGYAYVPSSILDTETVSDNPKVASSN